VIEDFWVRAEFSLMTCGYNIFIGNRSHVTKPLIFEHVESSRGEIREPSLKLTEDQAQGLMNDLWRSGLRPKGNKNVEEELNAINSHLEDMRQIAFSRLKIDKPED